jgi:hypothetical protein
MNVRAGVEEKKGSTRGNMDEWAAREFSGLLHFAGAHEERFSIG